MSLINGNLIVVKLSLSPPFPVCLLNASVCITTQRWIKEIKVKIMLLPTSQLYMLLKKWIKLI